MRKDIEKSCAPLKPIFYPIKKSFLTKGSMITARSNLISLCFLKTPNCSNGCEIDPL